MLSNTRSTIIAVTFQTYGDAVGSLVAFHIGIRHCKTLLDEKVREIIKQNDSSLSFAACLLFPLIYAIVHDNIDLPWTQSHNQLHNNHGVLHIDSNMDDVHINCHVQHAQPTCSTCLSIPNEMVL